MPRPTSLTPSTQARIIEALSKGASRVDAATAAGVGQRTLFTWLSKGEKGGKANEVYAQFRQTVIETEQATKLAAIAKVIEAEPKWWLERRFPDEYGRRSTVDVNVAVNVAVDIVADILLAIERDANLDVDSMTRVKAVAARALNQLPAA